jgi:hypothetical protein
MQTQEQVQDAIDKIGAKIIQSRNSFNELHKHLKADEKILAVCDTPISLAVVTNERFLRLTTSILSPTDVKEVFLKDITNIDINAGFWATKVIVKSAGGFIDLAVTEQEIGNQLKNDLNDAISKLNTVIPQKVDIFTQLEKLAELKERGILTETEFQEQKTKLLSQ